MTTKATKTKKTTTKKAAAAKTAKKAFRFEVGDTKESMKASILNHLRYTLARHQENATKDEWWTATCYAVRDRLLERFMKTQEVHHEQKVRRAYYLSLEYLMGRLLVNNLHNSGLFDQTRDALTDLGQDFNEVCDEEADMGLGNGGLGRLAACFLDSLATLDLPAVGYGIHYEFGLFRQKFSDGYQVELPDNWMDKGCPWEVMRPNFAQEIKLYGRVEHQMDSKGVFKPVWVDTKTVEGVPFDISIVGYGGETVNFLRLWGARSSDEFDLETFNKGGYTEAVQEKALSETITKVLYPNDSTESGKELRLVQQYFFVSCSLKDIIRRFHANHSDWSEFSDYNALQLNDTHPAIAIPELMRLLIDEYALEWDAAWEITRGVCNYTNHTLLPEALEKWSVPLFEKVLPRHLEIIYEINSRFLQDEVEAHWPGDDAKKAELSIIEEGYPKMVRMAYLSVVGSTKVNGVAALHTELLKKHLFATFHELYPNKLINMTNGITPRRWLLACNPSLSALITEQVGAEWPKHLDQLQDIAKLADDAKFQERFMDIKRANKQAFADFVLEDSGTVISPDAIFDVQIKRLHEYKRQHLNLLHILTLYRRLLNDPDYDMNPRVFIFGAKAAPGYALAKNIIRAINKVAEKVNNDPRINDKIKIVFPQNYRITMAEKMIPAADLSEQISTAGKEASGTGNMKLALNGALTIGTLDGANVEIGEEVGDENIFIFGNTVEQVEAINAKGYNPYDYYNSNWELKAVIDWLRSDYFTPGEHDAFAPLCSSWLEGGDPFLCLADYADYVRVQEEVDKAFSDKKRWAKMAIMNTARVGKFSSDRTISQYAEQIWHLKSVKVGA
ncbi:glycogen/starch/alpha-glucan phosphorylase [Coraliomargarita sp. SDUM461003]|uniref:Alpha-1,4 glucan phosphorylase n=1 Tax=Thalassobacterium maritimum TaxID=3041265 RepID=A0ABU1AXR2_9BACT|nr:glycogen/starch/alpha-glucan phosphorylase [Coraliomargarita sp. SDUM461003]MDQ8208954.1 glycogen/starch/alpha-glucan phosphorylase [Coraliomargarita sp. SDUM461003]